MTIFISGGVKNGKSTLAQKLAIRLAGEGKLYYVATMIPGDGEDLDRIRRHRLSRAGLGFETVECGKKLLSCLDGVDRQGTFLLDSITALLMNEMFPPAGFDASAGERCRAETVEFIRSVKNAVVVSDTIYADSGRYDDRTEAYRKALGQMECALAKVCDSVIEVAACTAVVHKGRLP